MEGDAVLNYIRKITAELFKAMARWFLRKKSMNDNQMEKELVLRNFNWKKAEEKIPKRI